MNKKRFDEIRISKNISLEKLSELTMIPISTLAKISSEKIQTSFENMCLIAKALECPLDDLADDTFYSLTSEARTFMTHFSSLSTQNKNAIRMIFEMEQHNAHRNNAQMHSILCYIPISCNGIYFAPHCLTHATLSFPITYCYQEADFAWKMTHNAYAPSFFESDILLFKNCAPKNLEVSLFQEDDVIFLSQSVIKDNITTLKPLPLTHFNSSPQNKKCRCLGTLHSVIRANSPFAERVKMTYETID